MFEEVVPSVQFVIKLAVGLGACVLGLAILRGLWRNAAEMWRERQYAKQHKNDPPPFNWWAEFRRKMGWPEGYIVPGGPHHALSFSGIPYGMCMLLERITKLEAQVKDLQRQLDPKEDM